MIAIREPRTVIGEEDNEGVVREARFVERRGDLTGAPVDFFTGVAVGTALALAAIFLARSKRHVRHSMSNVKEERSRLVLLDKLHGSLGVPSRELVHVFVGNAGFHGFLAVDEGQRREEVGLFGVKRPFV